MIPASDRFGGEIPLPNINSPLTAVKVASLRGLSLSKRVPPCGSTDSFRKNSMTEPSGNYVLCFSGFRMVNKRMAMFFLGIQRRGQGIRIRALPRGPWSLDKSEKPIVPSRTGRMTMEIGKVRGARLSLVLCFHWSVLPLAVAIGIIRRVPVLYDEHDHYEMNTMEGGGSKLRRRIYARLVRWIHRLCLPWVTLVTCIHMDRQTLKRHLERWQPAVLEIHNYPASIWRETGRVRTASGKLCFVYIGGVFAEKGVGAAAEAFQLLPEAVRQNSELHIFGEGDKDLMRRLQTMPGVTVHNGVTPQQFRQFATNRRCCGLALLGSTPRYNLVGTNCAKFFEYLALGMPVIATRIGEFPQIVDGHQLGLLIDGDLNPEQLAQQMLRLAEDEALFQQYSTNAATLMERDEMTREHEWAKIDRTGVIGRERKVA